MIDGDFLFLKSFYDHWEFANLGFYIFGVCKWMLRSITPPHVVIYYLQSRSMEKSYFHMWVIYNYIAPVESLWVEYKRHKNTHALYICFASYTRNGNGISRKEEKRKWKKSIIRNKKLVYTGVEIVSHTWGLKSDNITRVQLQAL